MLFCYYINVQGATPTISVDNIVGCQLYLSRESLETSITTAKATEVNVMVPSSDPDADLVCLLPFFFFLKNFLGVVTSFAHTRDRKQSFCLSPIQVKHSKSCSVLSCHVLFNVMIWLQAEHPLPQQYIHTYQDGNFVTNPVSHSGG